VAASAPQVAQLFEDFARRAMANPEEKLHAPFVAQLRQAGLLNLDDVTDRMLRILVELAVNHCLQVWGEARWQCIGFGPCQKSWAGFQEHACLCFPCPGIETFCVEECCWSMLCTTATDTCCYLSWTLD
jgi:hypothetical protein